MKKMYLFAALLLFLGGSTQAQTPTWSDDVAQLVYDKCGNCHHAGGLAPFSLLSYSDAFLKRFAMQSNVLSGNMPPWPPDDSYQTYAHKRSLTAAEKTLIDDWVNGGAPEGNAANTPPQPTYNQGSFLGTPDLALKIPNYRSKATASNDDYVCFSLPTNFPTNKKIKAIEVVPGNPAIVHHCLVYIDQSGNLVTDTSGNCAGPTSASLAAGYAPGEFPTIFANSPTVKMGAEMQPGANIILAMHYPEGSQGQLDSTKVHLFFYDDTVSNVRLVSADPILNDFGFCINANQMGTVNDVFPPSSGLPANITLLSVFPHGHLLAKDFLVFAVTALNDTIPLIRVPEWDFEWQGFYLFKNPIKLPFGSRVYGTGNYDNTTANPNNPNNPPQTVCAGLNTSDEMFLVYFHYLTYQAGDELLDMDSLTQPPNQGGGNPTAVINQASGSHYLMAYPNPFKQQVNIEYYLEKEAEVSLQVYDVHGRMVRQITNGQLQQGSQRVNWDGASDAGTDLANGLYLVYLKVGNTITTKKLMLSK